MKGRRLRPGRVALLIGLVALLAMYLTAMWRGPALADLYSLTFLAVVLLALRQP